ncbi:hypothetical protein OUZ56_013495 [Daphnia magna]|uniref:Uncharacterized protein n=1 Tax=Daphnia magna TaxID=35525 RepID=A0ABQ9Z621_9CRUS|nr:hypothetical protein OUZ56_013495 [Daphnia magna]
MKPRNHHRQLLELMTAWFNPCLREFHENQQDTSIVEKKHPDIFLMIVPAELQFLETVWEESENVAAAVGVLVLLDDILTY